MPADSPANRPALPPSPDAPAPALFSPISAGQRNILIDALRGFAIFGIFLVNMRGFKMPFAAAFDGGPVIGGSANEATLTIITVLAEGKFITLFALLFGLGMAMQEKRARAAGQPFTGFFLRRMLVLLAIGGAHAVLLWAGDILMIYAIAGIVAVGFLRCGIRTLLIFAGVVFALLNAFLIVTPLIADYDSTAPVFDAAASTNWWLMMYQTGNFGDIIAARWQEFLLAQGSAGIITLPYALTLFFVGITLGKLDLPANLEQWQHRFRSVLARALPLGLALTLAGQAVEREWLGYSLGAFLLSIFAYTLGPLLMALSYAILFYFLVGSDRAPRFVNGLAAVGRLALTNYLFQSAAANVIFMGWGFGFYGRVPANIGVLIVVAVFVLQVFLSQLWLRHFRIGPVEWLWRTASYGSAPRLR